MSKKNPYPRAIEILTSGKMDAQEICVALAKYYPTTFVKLYDLINPTPVSEAEPYTEYAGFRFNTNTIQFREIVRVAGEGRKIEAIKAMRAYTNMGLKEAKEYVEEFLMSGR